MKIGVLGTGDVGRAIGKGFITLGHEVMLAGREASNEKATAWAQSMGERAQTGAFADAAKFGEVIVLATLGLVTDQAIGLSGTENFDGKLVWDTTNPLDFSKGMPPSLVGGLGSSLGEKIQAQLPKAKVVKVFNTVGNALMFQPKLQGGIRPDMFVCGDDDEAKRQTSALLSDFGWDMVDVGGINCAHYLESMCMVWVYSALKRNTWMQAFKLLLP